MRLQSVREELVHYGRQLLECRLTTGTGGNLSIFDRTSGLIAMTPSGLPYPETRPEDILLLDPDGRVIECAPGRQPTSEWELHLAIYRARPDVCAVVHTHSVHATALACAGQEIRNVHYLAAVGGSRIRCAPYATYGTPELAGLCLEYLGRNHAVLLGNHGLVTVAGDLPAAFGRAEHLEYVAQLQIMTEALGGARLLSQDQMQEVRDRFRSNPYR